LRIIFQPEKKNAQEIALRFGDLIKLPLGVDEKAKVELYPERGFDVGEGPGKSLEALITGGQVGVIIDCRGRPLLLPEDKNERINALRRWTEAMEMYPA
jgi:hypothetical protein